MRFVCVNIEGSKHLDKIITFLKSENPDVVCMQEVIDTDISFFEKQLGMQSVYTGSVRDLIVHDGSLAGIAIFSKLPLFNVQKQYYVGSEDRVTRLPTNALPNDIHTFIQNAVLSADVIFYGKTYCIATTHGPWTFKGVTTDHQIQDFNKMISILDGLNEFVLAGDFNAPRMYKSFQMLAEKYKDNIPAQYTTSIDLSIHRDGKKAATDLIRMMVDGLFTTPKYKASNVRLVGGVSDHMAIVAEISQNEDSVQKLG